MLSTEEKKRRNPCTLDAVNRKKEEEGTHVLLMLSTEEKKEGTHVLLMLSTEKKKKKEPMYS